NIFFNIPTMLLEDRRAGRFTILREPHTVSSGGIAHSRIHCRRIRVSPEKNEWPTSGGRAFWGKFGFAIGQIAGASTPFFVEIEIHPARVIRHDMVHPESEPISVIGVESYVAHHSDEHDEQRYFCD